MTTETELEKWQRWYAGMKRAKEMWCRKYRKMRQQRDNALAELRQCKEAVTVSIEQNIDAVTGNLAGVKIDLL